MLFIFYLLLLIVELFNLLIEVLIDWVGIEYYVLLGWVKDMVFVVVILLLVVLVLVWGVVVYEKIVFYF